MVARRVPDDHAGLHAAVEVLQRGGIVALPTDTVYGIAVALEAVGGIERLFAAKDRPPDRAIMVLADGLDQVATLVEVPGPARLLADAFWPGGLTLVLPVRAGAGLPAALSAGAPTLGVRVPDHPVPRALARAVGPIPTTSANRSGAPEARDAEAVLVTLGDRVELIIDGGPSPGGVASTVVDCSGGPPTILRAGAIEPTRVAAVLDGAGITHRIGDASRPRSAG